MHINYHYWKYLPMKAKIEVQTTDWFYIVQGQLYNIEQICSLYFDFRFHCIFSSDNWYAFSLLSASFIILYKTPDFIGYLYCSSWYLLVNIFSNHPWGIVQGSFFFIVVSPVGLIHFWSHTEGYLWDGFVLPRHCSLGWVAVFLQVIPLILCWLCGPGPWLMIGCLKGFSHGWVRPPGTFDDFMSDRILVVALVTFRHVQPPQDVM